MRVLLSCLQSKKRHPIAAYEFWRPYFVHGCEEAGIEWVEVPDVDWAEGLVHSPGPALLRWRARAWDAVLAFVQKEESRNPIDLFLGYLYPCQVEVAAISELRRRGVPCVNFFCDNVREFRRVPDEFLRFDLHWVPEYEAVEMYRKARLPYFHAPMPCWVPPELRAVPQTETEPPTFVGSADVLRRELLGRALQEGAEFFIRGPGWIESNKPAPVLTFSHSSLRDLVANQAELVRSMGIRGLLYKIQNRLIPLRAPAIPSERIGPAPYGAEYFRITKESKVTIGVNRVPTNRASDRNPLSYSRLRDIEAPMLGACYLTEWTAGLGELYEIGVEIESYRTPAELVYKSAELGKDGDRRRAMRERAQRRALGEYSVARSLARLSKHLGL